MGNLWWKFGLIIGILFVVIPLVYTLVIYNITPKGDDFYVLSFFNLNIIGYLTYFIIGFAIGSVIGLIIQKVKK